MGRSSSCPRMSHRATSIAERAAMATGPPRNSWRRNRCCHVSSMCEGPGQKERQGLRYGGSHGRRWPDRPGRWMRLVEAGNTVVRIDPHRQAARCRSWTSVIFMEMPHLADPGCFSEATVRVSSYQSLIPCVIENPRFRRRQGGRTDSPGIGGRGLENEEGVIETRQDLRSKQWFGTDDLSGFIHRAWLGSEGLGEDAFDGRPVIGVANSWSEVANCNVHLRQLAEHVKRGIWRAGGLPLEFPVISLGEALMQPTTMLFRNLMAMDVEECIRAYPFDGVVLLSSCDKTTPAMLMGAASADVPAIMCRRPMLRGIRGTQQLPSATAVLEADDARRAVGSMTRPGRTWRAVSPARPASARHGNGIHDGGDGRIARHDDARGRGHPSGRLQAPGAR